MQVTTLSMEYDEANRLISFNGQKVKYDREGNMTYGPVNGEMTTLEYDCRNRLTRAGSTTYEYNAENTRTAVVENGVRTEYITDTVSTLSQVLETTTIREDGGKDRTAYIYGNGLLYEENSGTLKIHHYDHLGSTTALTDEHGNILAEYTYGTYGELLTGDKNLTQYLYNGKFGVITDSNNLYQMRARYYNVNTKRFINQDVVRGSIADSQSLNRYSYVQGNPVTLTDPFGLSPLANLSWKSIGHSLLNAAGMIPGVGDLFDLANAAWYLADGDYKNALLSGLSALPLLGDTVGAGLGAMKMGKAAKCVKAASRAISYGATFTQATGGAVRGARDIYHNIKDGNFFSKKNAMDMAGLAINTFTALCSGKAAYKYGSEAGGLMKSDVSDAWSNVKNKAKSAGSAIKKQTVASLKNNGGYVNLGWRNDTGNSNVYYQVTSKEVASKLIQSDNPVLSGKEFQQVYVWTKQPTLNQAKNSGARYIETVIKFETNETFFKDTTMKDETLWDIARISGRPGPISISNVSEVGFKQTKRWWQFWKK